MKIIIVAGGAPPSKKLSTKEITKNCIVIATDSGADCLWRYKIAPDYLIGDLDSINRDALKFLMDKNSSIEVYPCEKNFTDSELALKKAKELKKLDSRPRQKHSRITRGNDDPLEIVFLGAIGGNRADHFLAVLGLLDKCLTSNIKASLKDDYQTITLIKKSTTISGKKGNLFSLQAFGSPVRGLSITGSKYTLKNHTLKMGSGLTISNEFQNKKVNIKLRSGKLLVITVN